MNTAHWILLIGTLLIIFSLVWLAERYSKKKSKKIPIQGLILGIFVFLVGCYALYNLEGSKRFLIEDEAISPKRQALSKTSSQEQVLKNALSYLNEIPEIEWIEFDRNDVYIGFNKKPEDLSWIIRGAALKGNKAINFGVHVWAVSSKQKGWRPGDGPYLYEATARHGKVKK